MVSGMMITLVLLGLAMGGDCCNRFPQDGCSRAFQPIKPKTAFQPIAERLPIKISPSRLFDCPSNSISRVEAFLFPSTSYVCPTNLKCVTDVSEQWYVLQMRSNLNTVDFNRSYIDYMNGFGSTEDGYWLGLECLRQMISNKPHSLRIVLQDANNRQLTANYEKFSVADASLGYELTVDGFSGNGGDVLKRSNGIRFSTFDYDQDMWTEKNCAAKHGGGWWYKRCGRNAPNSFLNSWFTIGPLRKEMGVQWQTWTTQASVTSTLMMFRPQTTISTPEASTETGSELALNAAQDHFSKGRVTLN